MACWCCLLLLLAGDVGRCVCSLCVVVVVRRCNWPSVFVVVACRCWLFVVDVRIVIVFCSCVRIR